MLLGSTIAAKILVAINSLTKQAEEVKTALDKQIFENFAGNVTFFLKNQADLIENPARKELLEFGSVGEELAKMKTSNKQQRPTEDEDVLKLMELKNELKKK